MSADGCLAEEPTCTPTQTAWTVQSGEGHYPEPYGCKVPWTWRPYANRSVGWASWKKVAGARPRLSRIGDSSPMKRIGSVSRMNTP